MFQHICLLPALLASASFITGYGTYAALSWLTLLAAPDHTFGIPDRTISVNGPFVICTAESACVE